MGTQYSGSGDPRRTIELLWGVERPRRGPKPRFTVSQIARAAIDLADRDGLPGLSLRRVADELGITAMSLYGYVPSKAELLDVMVDQVRAELDVHRTTSATWRDALHELAYRHWKLCLAHPWLLQIAGSRPLLGPHSTAKYERELAAIDGIGLSDVDMDLVVSLLDDYVHGAARRAVEAAEAERLTGMTDQQWWETFGPLLGQVVDEKHYPTAVRVGAAAGAEHQSAYDPARSFEFGVQRILDSVEAYLGKPASQPRRPSRDST